LTLRDEWEHFRHGRPVLVLTDQTFAYGPPPEQGRPSLGVRVYPGGAEIVTIAADGKTQTKLLPARLKAMTQPGLNNVAGLGWTEPREIVEFDQDKLIRLALERGLDAQLEGLGIAKERIEAVRKELHRAERPRAGAPEQPAVRAEKPPEPVKVRALPSDIGHMQITWKDGLPYVRIDAAYNARPGSAGVGGSSERKRPPADRGGEPLAPPSLVLSVDGVPQAVEGSQTIPWPEAGPDRLALSSGPAPHGEPFAPRAEPPSPSLFRSFRLA
jgi:hypothetical protein